MSSGVLTALTAMGSGVEVKTARPNQPAGVTNAPVSNSPELQRIKTIPTRYDVRDLEERYREMAALCYRPGGTMQLRYEQPAALVESKAAGGLWAPIGVGRGKTLIASLLPNMFGIGPTVIFTNAGLVAQARSLMRDYGDHFYLRNDVKWISFSILSSAGSNVTQENEDGELEVTGLLERIKPRLIIADECQALANADAARTKRFNRYMKAHPDVIFCAMSGSVTKTSIKDYAHLMHLALKERTPLPRDWKTLTEWAEAIDVSDRPRPPGALAELVTDEQLKQLLGIDLPDDADASSRAVQKARMYVNGLFMRSHNWDSEESAQTVELARRAIRHRVNDTLGVVASSTNELASKLYIDIETAPECEIIDEALKTALETWTRPDGEILTYGLEMARVSKHIRQGGYYRWVWPEVVEEEQKFLWLEARKNFRKELREFLKERSKPGLDSPFLVEQAIKEAVYLLGPVDATPADKREAKAFLALFPSWDAWVKQEDAMRPLLNKKPQPPTEWVWVSRAVVDDVVARVRGSDTPMAVWADTRAVGEEMARVLQLPWYGAGEDSAVGILKERGNRSIVASIRAHGTGRNMQAFWLAFVVGWPPSGAIDEQLLGRHHRDGQQADQVRFKLYSSFLNELRQAIRHARYIEGTTGTKQKLLTAEMTDGHNAEVQ